MYNTYYKYYPNNQRGIPNSDRQFFFPFLVGAVAGGAAVGLTRPRPVYTSTNNQPYPYQGRPGFGYYSNYGYYNPGYYYRPY